MKIRIYYEDTDVGGVVYHSNYLKYCERARSEAFFAKNISPILNDAHFVVRKINCDYILPAYFGDIMEVSTRIKEIKKVSLLLEHNITVNNKIIFKMEVMLVLANNGKPKRIDDEIRGVIKSIFS